MKVKAVRSSKDIYRLERCGEAVGVALRFTDDKWGLFDTNEVRIGGRRFDRPRDVANHMAELLEAQCSRERWTGRTTGG